MLEKLEFLKNAIIELTDFEKHELDDDMSMEDIALDSLDFVDIQIKIKKTYQVQIDPNKFINGEIVNITDFAKYIDSLTKEKIV